MSAQDENTVLFVLNDSIAIGFTNDDLAVSARLLSTELQLPVHSSDSEPASSLLMLTADGIELRSRNNRTQGPVRVDFLTGPVAYRRRSGIGISQPLARAIGLKNRSGLLITDATAGLGRDSFVFAALGCTVTLIERSAVIAVLLADGLRRAAADPDIGQWVNDRMRLIQGDAASLFTSRSCPETDVVYLDPMYPHRTKSALVKKEMRLLREVVGDDPDAPALLAAALNHARQRVVVKRPGTALPLSGPKPDFCIESKSTRYDVYLTSHRTVIMD